MMTERVFPERCPNCQMPAAVSAVAHCPSPTCWWLKCTCGAVMTEAGKYMMTGGGA